MEIINSRWAKVINTEKGIEIFLSKIKPNNNSNSLYEDVKIVIDNSVLTLEGKYHLQKRLFGDSQKIWYDGLYFKPLPEDEYLIHEGYKSMMDRWKGIKSKYLNNYTTYSYGKEERKLKSNNFSIFYAKENVLESKEELNTFNEFVNK